MIHIPVLLEPVLCYLDIQEGSVLCDATIGFGGHSEALLKQAPIKALLGVDQDHSAITHCQKKFLNYPEVSVIHDHFSNLPNILDRSPYKAFDRILIDLGMSSFQLDRSCRGFSFQRNEPLDMRMNIDTEQTAAVILNTYSQAALLALFEDYGDIFKAEKFVDKIQAFRKKQAFSNTTDLITCIKQGFYFYNQRKAYIRMCMRVFQSLRIEVNQEMSQLDHFLMHLKDVLAHKGRVGIISFHSIEDRRVKKFQKEEKGWLRKVTKKTIQTSYHDAKKNPRARSAKLRVFERV